MAVELVGPLTRVMLFVRDVPAVAAFYIDVLGLTPLGEITAEWAELSAGGCNIALHRGAKAAGSGRAKLVFGVRDVVATREALIELGVAMGEVSRFDGIAICDGGDPEGNRFQISSREIN